MIDFTRDTVYVDNSSPCVSIRYFVVPVDIWNNHGESSDTIEVFYNDETYDCLYISSEKPKYIKRGRSFTFYAPKPIKVSIYDVSGRKRFEGVIFGTRNINLKRGAYFIKFGDEVKKEVIR